MKRTRRKPMTPDERAQAENFHAAFEGWPCASCGTEWAAPDVHHVVEKQELKDRRLPLYDTRNGLPLCPILSAGRGENCHGLHTLAAKRVPFRKLRPENIAYAYEVLGDYAGDYLKRFYPMDETEEKAR